MERLQLEILKRQNDNYTNNVAARHHVSDSEMEKSWSQGNLLIAFRSALGMIFKSMDIAISSSGKLKL